MTCLNEHEFRPGDVHCVICYAHREGCDCWRCLDADMNEQHRSADVGPRVSGVASSHRAGVQDSL